MKAFVTILGILFILVGSAFAETDSGNNDLKKTFLYEWVDEGGVVNIADSLGKIPEQYRSSARKLESGKGPEVSPGQQWDGTAGFANPPSYESEGKAEWQQRLRESKTRLNGAETRYRELERERNELFRAWGTAAFAPIENRLRAEQLDQQMKEVLKEIEDARRMIDTVIPEEARKAGVPPGWLRE